MNLILWNGGKPDTSDALKPSQPPSAPTAEVYDAIGAVQSDSRRQTEAVTDFVVIVTVCAPPPTHTAGNAALNNVWRRAR